MKFSAQEEYGLRCLVAVAQAGPQCSLTIPELSRQEGLSQPHVAKLMSLLRNGGYVSSSRGQVGGYQLTTTPDKIVLSHVLSHLGGRLHDERFCERHSGLHEECVHKDQGCLLHGLWDQVQAAVDGVLLNLTLQDILDGKVADKTNVTFAASRSPA